MLSLRLTYWLFIIFFSVVELYQNDLIIYGLVSKELAGSNHYFKADVTAVLRNLLYPFLFLFMF